MIPTCCGILRSRSNKRRTQRMISLSWRISSSWSNKKDTKDDTHLLLDNQQLVGIIPCVLFLFDTLQDILQRIIPYVHLTCR